MGCGASSEPPNEGATGGGPARRSIDRGGTGGHTHDNTIGNRQGGHRTVHKTKTTDEYDDHRGGGDANASETYVMGRGGYRRVTTPPPKQRSPPPPRKPPTPHPLPTPPPRQPTPPPRQPTPPPRQPTPPPRQPTPPARDPTPPPADHGQPFRKPSLEPVQELTPPPREMTRPQPHHQQQQKSADGYIRNETGVNESSVDFRRRPEPLDKDFGQKPNQLPYTDHDFGPSVAIKGTGGIEWKRPHEFRDNPVLFSDGTTRFDIGQGSAGTCWFLSMVAGIADNKNLFHRVVPKDAWNQEGGYFHCLFWRYGEWEDVYIDDYLPTVHGTQLWGAKSRDDENEIWPALLEKAFARLHGNYDDITGGQAGDAFLALTGGCSEYIDHKDLEGDSSGSQMDKARILHRRLKNACQGDALLATEVPERYDGHCGLIGGHAYSLTGAVTVQANNGREVDLVRVRNPWGHTEWQGAWKDGGSEWNSVPQNAVEHANIDDGEFWIELKEFIKYFAGVTVCSLTPDFDKDGCADSLNYCTTILGDWVGENAAGFKNRINNPRYKIFVPDDGMDDDGLVPMVIQICQKLRHRKKDKTSIRSDLYKIVGDELEVVVCELLGENTNVYKTERQMSNRYKVEPGYYAIVPSTIDKGVEKDFLLRVYAPCAIQDITEIGRKCSMMEAGQFTAPNVAHVDNKLKNVECAFGAWRAGDNSGGQVSHDTFYKNPQIEFEIPNRVDKLMVNFCLMQEVRDQKFPIGIRVFPIDDGYEVPPVDECNHQEYLYGHYDDCPSDVEGNKGCFIVGSEACLTMVLPPGRYFALCHMDSPADSSKFALLIRSPHRIMKQKHHF